MTIEEAFTWIHACNVVYGTGPGVICKSEKWIITAGEACRRAIAGLADKPPSNSDIYKELGLEEPSDDIVL